MKYLVVTVLLLFSCTDELEIYKNCFNMIIPKGNPIKFWLNGEESFNEKIVPGMQQQCFHQQFNTTDEIRLQVLDTVATAYQLKIYDVDDVLLETLDFTESSDVFNLDFLISDYSSLHDKKVYFKIGTYEMTVVETDDFASDLESWILDWGGASLSDWAWNAGSGGSMRATTVNTFGVKNYQRPITLPQQASIIRVTYNPIAVPNSANLKIGFALKDGSGAGDIITSGIILENLTGDGSVDYNLTTQSYWEDTTYLGIYVASTGYVAGDVIDFMKLEILTRVFSEVAFTDLINIMDDDDTVLIQYGDKNNYAEIDYTAQQIYSIRLAGRFGKERTQEENESDQTSDGAVEKLSSTLKDQKLLEIEYAPPYIHKLMKRILNHNTIYIDGEYWVKEENYEARDVSNSQPLQPATCWLTQKEDGYNTNVYGTLTNI